MVHFRQESLSDFGMASAGFAVRLGGRSRARVRRDERDGVDEQRRRRDARRSPQASERRDAVPRQHEHPRQIQLVREPRGGERGDARRGGRSLRRRRRIQPPGNALRNAVGDGEIRRHRVSVRRVRRGPSRHQGRGPGGVPGRTPASPTFVRLDGGRNLVLFAPSLGHAVAALPEASTQKPGGALVRHLVPAPARPRGVGRARVAAAAFVSGQTSRRRHLAQHERASPSPCSPSARRLSTSPLRAPAPPEPLAGPGGSAAAPASRPPPRRPAHGAAVGRRSPPRGSSRRSPSRVDSGRTSRRRWRWSAWPTSRWSASA